MPSFIVTDILLGSNPEYCPVVTGFRLTSTL